MLRRPAYLWPKLTCSDGSMITLPPGIDAFLSGSRVAVAGVSRSGQQPANAILRKLRDAGYDAVPINPHASQLEGVACYPDLAAVPGEIDGLLIAAHPDVAENLVRQAHARGIRQVWFHRSFGAGSVSDPALKACRALGIEPIVGGCPLMFIEPVDLGHRCMRWWLGYRGRLPG